jgi:hypothetical protein
VVLPISVLSIHPRRDLVRKLPLFYLLRLLTTLSLLSIIGSLAGTSYWGPVAGHGLLSHDLELIRAERKQSQTERSGIVPGNVEALLTGAEGDNYVKIREKHLDEDGEKGDSGKSD